ncbi:hypothetical protein ACWEN3_08805 [Streptomyces sp. NPDC004561]
MTYSSAPAAPAVAVAVGARRRVLRWIADGACLPYRSLKIAWIAGSHLGIPDGSPLLEHRLTLALVNGLTVLMDAAVVVLAQLLTRPWGRRVPTLPLVVPMWCATGLLTPIMVGFPLQLALGGGGGGGGDESFLAEWVFGVVYGGFIVQGLALGALFAGYARDRWGRLWRGRVRELPVPGAADARRPTAVAAALIALVPAGVRLLRACGATAGVGRSGDPRMEVVLALFLAAAVTGAWQLAFRRGRTLPVAVPLALAWTGSAAVACWGGWVSLAGLVTGERPTPLLGLTYAGQMIVGFLVAALTVRLLAERSAKGTP